MRTRLSSCSETTLPRRCRGGVTKAAVGTPQPVLLPEAWKTNVERRCGGYKAQQQPLGPAGATGTGSSGSTSTAESSEGPGLVSHLATNLAVVGRVFAAGARPALHQRHAASNPLRLAAQTHCRVLPVHPAPAQQWRAARPAGAAAGGTRVGGGGGGVLFCSADQERGDCCHGGGAAYGHRAAVRPAVPSARASPSSPLDRRVRPA